MSGISGYGRTLAVHPWDALWYGASTRILSGAMHLSGIAGDLRRVARVLEPALPAPVFLWAAAPLPRRLRPRLAKPGGGDGGPWPALPARRPLPRRVRRTGSPKDRLELLQETTKVACTEVAGKGRFGSERNRTSHSYPCTCRNSPDCWVNCIISRSNVACAVGKLHDVMTILMTMARIYDDVII